MKRRQVHGRVMFDLAGPAVSPEERDRLQHPATGGVILFERNYRSPEQLRELVATIRAIRPEILLAVDHEGGRVQRFREGFTRLPPASSFLKSGRPDALELVELAGWVMAVELRAHDIDFSFAPVLDVDVGISAVIGDRAFADNPVDVTAAARAYVRGVHRAGMSAVGKHFPGHGGVAADSHLALPIDDRTFEELEARDLLPFAALIREGLEAVMPAHVLYPRIDSQPAGYSRFWLQTILRDRLGFDGAIFSDDLSMAGAAAGGDPTERARLAIEAGCDMVLVCNAPEAAGLVLQTMEKQTSRSSEPRRLEAMRGRLPCSRAELQKSTAWRRATEILDAFYGNPV
ncbi:MAG TPA: beta-N-acetylhexosaminidase [Methylococcus sp.]|nr:beta-N-acetylhexosaminidase [Methylococcus sp.]